MHPLSETASGLKRKMKTPQTVTALVLRKRRDHRQAVDSHLLASVCVCVFVCVCMHVCMGVCA